MTTFEPISYTYVPTPLRSKSTTARHKIPPKPFSILDKNQHIKPSSVALEKPRPLAVAATVGDIRDEQSKVRTESGNIHSDTDKENNDDNDDYFPTVEEMLYTALHKEGFAMEYSSPGPTEETGASADHGRSKSDDGSGTSRSDPIILGEDESDNSEAEVDYRNHRGESAEPDAALFGSTETALDSRILVRPSYLEGCHDIKHHSSTKTAQRLQLAEEGAAASDAIHPYSPSSRPSSEPLHDHSRTDKLCGGHARSKATISHFGCPQSQPPHCSRTSPQYKPSQEDHLPTSRSASNEDKLLSHTLVIGTDTFAKENKQKQQQQEEEEEEEEEEDNDDDENNEDKEQYGDKDDRQREVNNVAVAQTARRGGDTHLSSEDESALPAKRQRPLHSHNPILQPGQEGTGSHSGGCSDGGISNTRAKSDEEQRPRSAKRKQPSSSDKGTRQKKRRHYLQHQSTRQPKPCSRSQRPCVESALPSPAPSTPQALDTELLSDLCTVGGSSRDIRPTLTEITFRPHSLHECSFTAVIRANHGRPEFSFGQVTKLIENIGYVRKIDDFTIKPLTQNSFLLVGFSGTLVTASEASCIHRDAIGIRLQHGKAVDARATALCKGELSCSEDGNVLNDSDPDLSSNSDDDGSSAEDEQGRSSTRKNSVWLPLDEQRLLAYKKEGKSWSWIFRKFPGRTSGAVRTRWHMVQARLPEWHEIENDEGAGIADEAKPKRRRGRPPKKN